MARSSIEDLNETEAARAAAFRDRLPRAIARAGFETSREFCQAVGISPGSYRQYMLGSALPTSITLMRMADVLGTSCDWLLGYPVRDIVERLQNTVGRG